MKRVVVVLAVSGCWGGPPPTAPAPTVASKPMAHVDAAPCPVAMDIGIFNYVRHELFPGCAPTPFGAEAFDCAGRCPTPCGGAVVELSRGQNEQVASWTVELSGDIRTTDVSGMPDTCRFERERVIACTLPDDELIFSRSSTGRLEAIAHGNRRVVIKYDDGNRLSVIDDSGLDGREIYSFSYDKAGRLIGESRNTLGEIMETVHRYDAQGLPRTTRTLDNSASGESFRREQTYRDGRLDKVSERGLTFERVWTYEYDAKKRPTKITGAETTFGSGEPMVIPTAAYVYRYECTR